MAERIQFVDYLNTKIQIIPREWSKIVININYYFSITCTFSLKNYLSHITINFIVITSLSRCDYKTVLTCILLYLTVDRFRQKDGMVNFRKRSRPSYTLALDTCRQPPGNHQLLGKSVNSLSAWRVLAGDFWYWLQRRVRNH